MTTKYFMLLWRPEQVEYELGRGGQLNHAASNQLRRVSLGDVVWIVTVTDDRICTIGRIVVDELVDQDSAARRLGTADLWEADYHIIGQTETVQRIEVVAPLTDIAHDFRFVSRDAPRLTYVGSNLVAQQLRTMRQLTPATADLIEDRWNLAMERLAGHDWSKEL